MLTNTVDLIQVFVLFLFRLSLRKGRTAPKAQRARSARAAGEGKFLSLPSYPFILLCLRYSEIKTETCSKSTNTAADMFTDI